MKKRLMILFSITAIILFIILFYEPKKDYLVKYKNKITIDQIVENSESYWTIEKNNDNLSVEDNALNDNTFRWTFKPISNGDTIVTFRNIDNSDSNIIRTITYKFTIKENYIIWTSAEASGYGDFSNPY